MNYEAFGISNHLNFNFYSFVLILLVKKQWIHWQIYLNDVVLMNSRVIILVECRPNDDYS